MAMMVTPITQFSDQGNSRTWVLPDHQAVKPFMLKQTRVPKSTFGQLSRDVLRITSATATDSATPVPMQALVSIELSIARPVGGDPADVTRCIDLLRDIVASGNLDSVVTKQLFLDTAVVGP